MTAADTRSSLGSAPWLAHYPQYIDKNEVFKPIAVPDLLDKAVARHAARPATQFLGASLTYGDLGRQVDRAAKGLQSIGVKKGMKVGLFLPNCPTFIVYYFAILKVGGTVVNYNPLYTLDELSFQVRDSDTEIMVTLDLKLLFDKVEPLLASGTLKHAVVASFVTLLPASKSVMFRLFRGREQARVSHSAVASQISIAGTLEDNDGAFKPVAIDPNTDIAVLQYTGGTTGTPKGAMLTHGNLTVNVQQSLAWTRHLAREGTERILGILPLFHVFAMSGIMNYGIALGAEIILMPRFVLDDAIALIAKARPTIMPAVPTIFGAIMNHKNAKTLDLHSLKICLSGGAPLPAEVRKGFEELTGAQVIEAYGLSETSPGATANPVDGRAKAGSIGQPLPGTMISIREVGNPAREVPLGQPGEICIKGPQVMKGYYNQPQATAETFVGDYFRTGDVGYMDPEGFIFIVDRIKDMIICSGFKVYPRHLEERIYEHPAVEEVTVIGIKDAYRGEAPKAFIKLRAGQTATAEDIRKHLETRLSKIEMPAEIEFRTELPKTMIGKLSKKELKAEEQAKPNRT
jgi:long-chain acyl-CoA synthetase